ncbi:DoxX family protein [Rhizobium sp. P38BS-XIX]|uniref:DoxX family protein n=1 Tax=Rhizobium sp. P38BS-XIX TaxID=2726740 RepID=UPI0014567FE4|nr:DoxX family protein [Rhizobium sp. P38BS-XIX]NLS01549.1 DoxX family protein [Rhizobium sp. P38BS-XIX]
MSKPADHSSVETSLFIPGLAGFYRWARPVSYALLRLAFGLTIVTHGLPKIMRAAHGTMADPMQGSINIITNSLHLPFASELATVVTLLETFGGLAVAVGLFTRLFAPMLAVEMAFISIAMGPTWPWIDRGIEYPVMLGFMALLISIHGGGPVSLDARIGREL